MNGCEYIPVFCKSENEKLDYKVDWSLWLGADQVDESEWTVPAGLTQESHTFSAKETTVWISGGTLGTVYTLVNKITTLSNPPRIAERTIKINLTQR